VTEEQMENQAKIKGNREGKEQKQKKKKKYRKTKERRRSIIVNHRLLPQHRHRESPALPTSSAGKPSLSPFFLALFYPVSIVLQSEQ
jgi:hypothetical protein